MYKSVYESVYESVYKLVWIATLGLCAGCQGSADGKLLPVASGEEARILFVADAALWKGTVGTALRGVFAAPMPGLPQAEPSFSVSDVPPGAFNSTLRRVRYLVFLGLTQETSTASQPLSSFFSREAWAQIAHMEAPLYRFERDVYAREQHVLLILAKDSAMLLRDLPQRAEGLRDYFEKAERLRVQKKLFSFREKGIEQTLAQTHPFSWQIPKGYQLVKNEKDFVWLRQLGAAWDKSIFVHVAPYHEALSAVKARRRAIGRHFFQDPEKPLLHMTHQEELPFAIKEVNFKGLYALEARGLWKLSDNSIGGPFVSYSLVDSSRNRLYYLEGFVYCPSEEKRRHIRELEAILWKFSP